MSLILGKNRSAYGLFIAKNRNPLGTGYDVDDDLFSYSSAWTNIAQIYKAGLTPPDTTVSWVGLGYRPLVRFERIIGGTIDMHPAYTSFASTGANGKRDTYAWSRFRIAYTSDNGFQIVKRETSVDTGSVDNFNFRYVVFNIAVDS